jgi:hypothetical protein
MDIDRSRLPAALRNVRLDHLSSGALMMLDRDGDLVRPPRSSKASTSSTVSPEAAGVALDPRVGANIRLGDDPAVLPANQRAQAEPHIARSIGNPDLLLATFQEGRFTDGGAVDCGYSVSHDGGLTWSRALLPGVTQAAGGPYFRDTDPVAAIDLNGNLYVNTIAATDPSFNTGVVLVSRSTNGGATFSPPVAVFSPPSNTLFPDKEWFAINTFAGTPTVGRIVVTFTLFGPSSTSGGSILRTYSDDAGATWSQVANINTATANLQGSQPVFLPDGKLAVVYWNFGSQSSPGERLEVVISDDGGVTFGSPILITFASEYGPQSIRSGAFLPSAATDRGDGSLYVVYQTRVAGSPRIVFTKSINKGQTWSAPIPISDNPSSSPVFNPAIGASPDGQTLTAAFYDGRANPGSNTMVDMFLAQSFDGGATWQPNIRLTSVSTDASLAPNTGSPTSPAYMLGDYLGIAESTNANVPAVPVWVDTRTGNPDPFITRVGIAPQVNFTSWQAARLSLAQINQPGVGGPGGDADHDGEDNLSEFQSLTDPNDPNSVVRSARDLNISTRARVETGDNVLIGGFIITGTEAKKVLLRATGPSLSSSGIADTLPDPILELHSEAGALIANDDWKDSPQAGDIQATGIAPADDRESAILQTLVPGAYTAVVRGKGSSTGVALVEVYDLGASANAKLANISTRGFVNTGDNVVIGGFIVGGGLGTNGDGSAKIVVRGMGPSLTQAGVPGALQDPTLELHDGNGTTIGANDDWRQNQATELQMAGLAPSDDRESAILTVLTQGNYTAILRGKANTTGVGLVEVYNIQ